MRTLQTAEISKSYNGRKVVDNVSIRVEQGEVVGLLGPNGAGKTTSFYITVGLVSPESGDVLLDDEAITRCGIAKATCFRAVSGGVIVLPGAASKTSRARS